MSNIQRVPNGTEVDLPFTVSSDDLPHEFNQFLIGFEKALATDPSISAKSKPHSLSKTLVSWIDPASEWIRSRSQMQLPDALPFSKLAMISPDRAANLARLWYSLVPDELRDCVDALQSALSLAQIYVPGAKEVFVYSPHHIDEGGSGLDGLTTNPIRGSRSSGVEHKGGQLSYLKHRDEKYCRFCGRLTEIESRRMELIQLTKTSRKLKAQLRANMPLIERGLSLTYCSDHVSRKGHRSGYDQGRKNYPYVASLSYLARLQTGVFLIPIDVQPRTLMVEIFNQLGRRHPLIRNLPQLCKTFDFLSYRGSKQKTTKALNREFRRILEAVASSGKLVPSHVIDMRSQNAALGTVEQAARIRQIAFGKKLKGPPLVEHLMWD